MREIDISLKFLGERIYSARKICDLTQMELAQQTQLAVKTVQDIESGRKNPTYDTLVRLVKRLGISPDTLFPTQPVLEHEDLQRFVWKFQCCSQEDQKILLNTLNFLTEQLLKYSHETEKTE